MNERAIIENADGTIGILVPAPNCGLSMAEIVAKDAAGAEIVDVSDIPSDRTFRNAWKADKSASPDKVMVDMPLAKEITHSRRRVKRSEEFVPLDIQATIPTVSTAAESNRQVVRDRYAVIQTDIDNAPDVDTLLGIIAAEGI
jgi:hypothetical protein